MGGRVEGRCVGVGVCGVASTCELLVGVAVELGAEGVAVAGVVLHVPVGRLHRTAIHEHQQQQQGASSHRSKKECRRSGGLTAVSGRGLGCL